MYWTKIILSIVYAICLIVALFILIGCKKTPEKNPEPEYVTTEKVAENGEMI